eukprot:gb/GECG01010729.1/.p1 GENE.gb/GECG01010729.1/~~gb/GECG01010729.1/.p1  ORF type:complete len:124 (+),score=19.25 gb/GECG01010729.1/:1-372(+)
MWRHSERAVSIVVEVEEEDAVVVVVVAAVVAEETPVETGEVSVVADAVVPGGGAIIPVIRRMLRRLEAAQANEVTIEEAEVTCDTGLEILWMTRKLYKARLGDQLFGNVGCTGILQLLIATTA